jgi:dienelactone hydrolase
VRTRAASDRNRDRRFPVEIWYPARGEPAAGRSGADLRREAPPVDGNHPLIVFSHHAGGSRLSAAFLGVHLASHGYVVAALDHSEVVASDLAPGEGETATHRAARVDNIIASRVPDVRFLLDYLLSTADVAETADLSLDAERVGLVGHSFGGWTVLATAELDRRIRSVAALGPGGSTHPRPGVLPLTLTFDRHGDVPTLYLAAENDTPVPVAGVRELFDRTPGSKRMFILRRADHQHFLDDVEGAHEAIRAMSVPGAAAWIPAAMRPIAELATAEQAHLFVRGLTLAHLDATLRHLDPATRWLAGDVQAELAARGVEALAHPEPNEARRPE